MEIDLLNFGTNENGEYCDLIEWEKHKQDISEQELIDQINKHENPLIRLADFMFCGYEWDGHCYKDILTRLEKIITTKTYHYGNFKNSLYIFSLYDELTDRYVLVFQNEKHYLIYGCNDFYWKEHEMIDYTLEDYLLGKTTISFPALYCPCFDINGNKIEQYSDEPYTDDIRHIVCIKEWRMDHFSKNRIQDSKKIKDFYEVEFTLPALIEYWGESE